MSRSTARAFVPFVAALFVASCSLFAPSAPEREAHARVIAACVADEHCTSRACLEAALLRCSADEIEATAGAGGRR